MNVRTTRTKAEYEEALERLAKVMASNPLLGPQEGNMLELLLLVIADYEQKFRQTIVPDPIESIKFRMDQMQFTRNDLVPFLGSLSKVSEVLSRKRNLSLTMIRKLHEGLGIPLESLVQRGTLRKPVRQKKFKMRSPSRVSKHQVK